MASTSTHEPDRRDLWSRQRQTEVGMLDTLLIRSDAAKNAAAEESAYHDNLMKAADAKARTAIQIRAAEAKQTYEAECNAVRRCFASPDGRETLTSSGNVSDDPGSALSPRSTDRITPPDDTASSAAPASVPVPGPSPSIEVLRRSMTNVVLFRPRKSRPPIHGDVPTV